MQFHRPVKLKLVTVRRAKFGRVKRCVPLLQVGHFFVADGYAIHCYQIIGSKPFPGRKRSIAPRFGYALSVAHGASSPRVRAFDKVAK